MSRDRWLGHLLIVLLGFVAFSPVLHVGFQLDDHVTIESNPAIRTWSSHAVKEDFIPNRNDAQDIYYRPMQTFVNRLQYTAWKLNPAGYHLTNLLLHIANAILIAELLLQLSLPSWAALATGSLFVVHPIIVSELLMISGIPEIMSLFFGLTALLLFLQRKFSCVLLGSLSYGLALLSKESAIVIPLYFLLFRWIQKRSDGLGARMTGFAVMTLMYIVLRTLGLGWTTVHGSIRTLPLFLAGQFPAILWRYVGLIFLPWHLHSYRLIPAANVPWAYGAGIVLYGAYLYGKRPAWARFCALWFLISFIPKIPLMATGHFMLEHWAYPGLPAIILPVSLLLTGGWLSSDRVRRSLATGLFAAMLCGCIFSAQFHVVVRATDEQNYRWSLRFTRATPLLFNLGLICLRTGRAAEAVTYFEPVHALNPDDSNISKALALAYARSRRPLSTNR